ncbi:MAG: hypothetical protein IT380_19645 [Myxococcales bacterium]|nr:hypothetical protein [Myxococcales bacterium]
MRRFPKEFASLLSKEGRAVLRGTHRLAGVLATGKSRFVAATGLLDSAKAHAAAALLDRALGDALEPMEKRIPREATWGMKEAYLEALPKTVRVQTGLVDTPRTAARARAKELGLIGMLRSPSMHEFAQALSGYPLRRRWGLQVLCYGPKDYAGPHNDHHPDEPLGKDGYTDLHLTFCTRGVKHQYLVYERDGHLTESADVASVGGVTCYRLPFWHYTTPLEPKRGREDARRWVLLATFLDRWGG